MRSESSDLPALRLSTPRKSQDSTGSPVFVGGWRKLSDWQKPDLSVHGKRGVGWRRGRQRREASVLQ